ncbi:MAG: hypothetical protein HY235_27185 [Acidobacteria bacterium]|nr:hypothetical protein [Acidobacteriota bacterium]
MEARKASVETFPSINTRKKRPYGKSPLEFDLSQAVEAIGRFAQEGKALPVTKLAILLGNTTTSSAFTKKLRALSCFGLLDDQADGSFALTERALAIGLPRSAEDQAQAMKEAFLQIEQFNLLFRQHKGKLLPADEFLRNILEHEGGIPREFSDVWVKQFKTGAMTAGLFHGRGDGKIQIVESPVVGETTPYVEDVKEKEKSAPGSDTLQDDTKKPLARADRQPLKSQASGHYTRIDFSDGRQAEIMIPDRLTPRDAQKLQKALDGVKVIIESMIYED